MPKTVEEIKADITALVKSQGNQGAISLGTVLDDLTDLAGGGGGTASPMLIEIYQDDDRVWHVISPSLEDVQRYMAAAIEGAHVSVKMYTYLGSDSFQIRPIGVKTEDDVTLLAWTITYVTSTFVENDDFSLNPSTGEITVTFRKNPAD